MEATRDRGLKFFRMAGLLAVLVGLLLPAFVLPAAASAADSIYWGNEGSGAVRVGNLEGTGAASNLGGLPSTTGGSPCGVAIDSAAGKIYWANWFQRSIQRADLDGTDVETLFTDDDGNLCGVAVDPPNGRIYWANFNGEIWGANLASVGTSAAALVTGEGANGPSGVAVDPAAGKLYWTNQFPSYLGNPPDAGQVRRANLDGSNVQTVIGGQFNPIGVAVAAGKIYWTNLSSGAVRSANLTEPFPVTPDPDLATGESSPGGVAVDTSAGRIYWANFSGAIRGADLADVSGSRSTLFSTPFIPESGSLFTALLRAPAGTGDPTISSGAGGELTCSKGSWASDLLGVFLYRAPQSFAYQWLLDGNPISGADQSTLTPSGPGDYTCEVTASNHAGPASQTSEAFNVPAQATLGIEKFYDANANGAFDATESAIAGWKVQLDGSAYLTPQSLTVDPDDYMVAESDPLQTNWRHTTPSSVQVSLNAGDEETVEFGNVCVGAGGALSTGYWSNKNGQARIDSGDLLALRDLNLRNANGSNFDPTTAAQVKTFLNGATATNMANMLSAQLAAMTLNVLNGVVNGSSLIYAPGTTSANSLGFATVNAVTAEANTELGLHPSTKSGSPYRAYQTALKDALFRAISNVSFVQATPCPFTFAL